MRINLDDCSFGQLQLVEEMQQEYPGRIRLKKIPKEDGEHFHYAVRLMCPSILAEFRGRLIALERNQEILRRFYDLPSFKENEV